MSKAELFTELTNLVDVDPFALIGVSVSADEKRISKRYRQIAKQLHPDALTGNGDSAKMTQSLAAKVIARIVNPSYQKLKHEKSRQESLCNIRLMVRRLIRTEKLVPTFRSAQELMTIAKEEVDIFYEQSLSGLAECQFQSLEDLHNQTVELSQLNLVFLSRNLENLVIHPKRVGLMTVPVTPTSAVNVASGSTIASPTNNDSAANGARGAAEPSQIDYAKQHMTRAKKYLSQQNYELAVQELREALKIKPQSPEIHSMIGQAYYKQKLSGMAKTHFRQALKLKPTHRIALKYSKLLGMSSDDAPKQSEPTSTSPDPA